MSIPEFLFVGAGEAQYFEWAEIFVRFVRTPTETEKELIQKDIPPPLQDTMEWNGPLLWVSSNQGVGRYIRATYSTGKKKGQLTDLTIQSRFAQAGLDADAQFNAHIEAWLIEIHKYIPILVAFRREDLEAGGTELSDWHQQSIIQIPHILTIMSKENPTLQEVELAMKLAKWANKENVHVSEQVMKRFKQKK